MVKVASHQKIKEPKAGHQGTWLDKSRNFENSLDKYERYKAQI